MSVYLLNEALMLVWGFLFLYLMKSSRTGRWCFVTAAFLQMFLLACLRYRIGFDYDMYAQGFVLMNREGFTTLRYLDWEPGFVLLTKVIGLFTNQISLYMGILAAICLIPWAWLIYRYSPCPGISVLLFLNLYFLYLNMNFLRQAIAISITLFAWPFLKERKFWRFSAIIVLASLFHTTALVLLPVYLLLCIRPGGGLFLFYAYILLFFYISSEGILNLLTMVFHQEYANSIFLQGIPYLYALVPLVLLILLYVFRNQMMQINSYNRYLIGLQFFAVFCMVMMTRHAILERLSYYAYAYSVLAVPELLHSLKPRQQLRPGMATQRISLEKQEVRYAVVFLAVVILTCVHHLLGLAGNVHGVVPYTML